MKRRGLYTTLYWVLTILPLPLALVVFMLIPEALQTAPGVFAPSGRSGIFVLPAINFVFGVLFYFLTGYMNKTLRERTPRDDLPDTARFFSWLKLYTISFMDAMCLSVIYGYYALDSGGAQTTVLMCRAAVFMLGVGTAIVAFSLPRCTKGSILALRWTYTEKSDNVWYKTHKLGSRLFFAGGALAVLFSLMISGIHVLLVTVVLYILIFLTLYQYSKKLYYDEFFK